MIDGEEGEDHSAAPVIQAISEDEIKVEDDEYSDGGEHRFSHEQQKVEFIISC